MAFKSLSAKAAAALDNDLMSTGAFSIDQLMELAGLSVSQAGFSFSGAIREPFPSVIEALKNSPVPVTAVDAPSSWDIEKGMPNEGPGKGYVPAVLVSLTAPKPLASGFAGRHFLGGRFVGPDITTKYDLQVFDYEGVDQIVEIGEKEREGEMASTKINRVLL
ncbi:MAG: hypothetical protein M1814_001588 [Vezdaea aestivalis]|nr:MAG: hypothetical protein M1814_001588 [Vezdaea aestivalis]